MENDNNYYISSYTKLINLSLLVTLIISIIYLIIGLIIGYSYSLFLSYLIGALTNILGLTLIKNDINKKLNNIKDKGTNTFSFGGNILRLFIYGIVIYISTLKQTLNPFIVASGFITVKIAIMIYAFKYKDS